MEQYDENILLENLVFSQTDKQLIFENNIAKPNKQLNLEDIQFLKFSNRLLPDGGILMLFLPPTVYKICIMKIKWSIKLSQKKNTLTCQGLDAAINNDA